MQYNSCFEKEGMLNIWGNELQYSHIVGEIIAQ